MVVKVYISGISGNKEVKKRQQRVLMILESKNIKYEIIDITEPGRESDKDFMQNNSKSNGGTVSDPNPRSPLPPQVFNDEEYCGDYDQFDLANEVDTLEQFLKVEVPPESPPAEEIEKTTTTTNGDVKLEKDKSEERESVDRTQESPANDVNEEKTKEDSNDLSKEDSADKEKSPEPKVSEDTAPEETNESTTNETEAKLVEEEITSKEEASNENGAVSSREVSEEKESQEVIEQKKDNVSEALIQSEQAAASD